MLYQKGINEPLDKFFGSVDYVNDSPISLIIKGLEDKDFDVFGAYDSFVKIAGYMTKKDIFFEPLICEKYDHSWIFVARKDLPPDVVNSFRKFLLGAHKDPDFAKFQFAFQMIEGKFQQLKPEEIDFVKKNYELSEKQGWRKEEKVFYDKYKLKKGAK